MTSINQLIHEASVLRHSLEYYLRHGRCEDNIVEVTMSLVEKAGVLVASDRETPLGMLGCYTGMDSAKFLLENFFPMLHTHGLLKKVYNQHPNPTLLSKASRAYLWAMSQDHLENDRLGLSMEALELGGFPTLKDLQESFPNFKVENAPEPAICRLILENTFRHLELFSHDPLNRPHGGKYFTVLLAKMIDEGESAWAVSFIDKHLAELEGFSPISFRRLDQPEGFTFKDKFLVHIQHYLRCDRLLCKLAEVDEPSFNQVLSSPETHDHIAWAIGAREGFELSAIPLDPVMCKYLVTMALDHTLVGHEIKDAPLRILDFVRLEESFLTAGLSSNAFMQVLRKRPYFQEALKETERLILDLEKASGHFKKIQAIGLRYAGKSLDTVVVAAYANPQLRQRLLDNLEALSCLMALREHDCHVMLDVKRTHVSALELKTIILANEKSYSALCDSWVDKDLLKTPESIREIAKLTQHELTRFRKLAHDHFSENELRLISWEDHSIRDGFFGEDLGL